VAVTVVSVTVVSVAVVDVHVPHKTGQLCRTPAPPIGAVHMAAEKMANSSESFTPQHAGVVVDDDVVDDVVTVLSVTVVAVTDDTVAVVSVAVTLLSVTVLPVTVLSVTVVKVESVTVVSVAVVDDVVTHVLHNTGQVARTSATTRAVPTHADEVKTAHDSG
jgi:hypothetical protein